MRVEPNKAYITAGGYVVKLDYNGCAPGMSPGENDDYCAAGPGGWHWEKDGSIIGLTPEWMEKLKIIEECPFGLPTLPEGYRWTDGFPQVRIPKRGEYFLSYDSRTKKFGEVKCCDRDYVTPYGTDGRRLILTPETQKETWPRYFVGKCWGVSDAYVQYSSPTSYFWVNKHGAASPPNTENTPLTKEHLDIFKWKEVTKEEALKRVISPNVNSVTSVSDVSSFKKEEDNMKKETALRVAAAIAKFAGNWGFRTLNYWVFEPAAGFGKPIVKSVRYATFLTMVGGSIYGYYHPQEVKNAIKSCLPKITIEAPEIMQG